MITKAELEKYLGITIDDGMSSFFDTVVAGVELYIRKVTGRKFVASSPTTSTRYYNGNNSYQLAIDDAIEVTGLVVDGVTLAQNTDYFLYPLNASDEGRPYERIELIQPSTRVNLNSRISSASPYIFDEGQRSVAVTGKFAYGSSVPADIKLVAMKLCGGVIKENIGDNDVRELTSQNLGEFSASYTSIKNIAHSLGVDAILSNYVRADKMGVTSEENGGGVVAGFVTI